MSLSPGCLRHLDPLALEDTADSLESENRIPEFLSSLLQPVRSHFLAALAVA